MARVCELTGISPENAWKTVWLSDVVGFDAPMVLGEDGGHYVLQQTIARSRVVSVVAGVDGDGCYGSPEKTTGAMSFGHGCVAQK